MMNSLAKAGGLDSAKLDSEFYFESLLGEAYAKSLITSAELERIQYECIALLAERTERYNAGESSSIRIEKAQEIMTNNLFTLGVQLKTYASPGAAVTALQSEPVRELYRKGSAQIDEMLHMAKQIHKRMISGLFDTPNEFYRATIADGIAGFFKLYRPDFAAHEIHITADYPVFNRMPKLAGIEFIMRYQHGLYHENLFLRYFPAEAVHHLLCGYAPGCEKLLLNLYEPVLLAALGCTILKQDIYELNISQEGAERLHALFADMPRDEILVQVQKAGDALINRLKSPRGLRQYMKESLLLLAARIKGAVRTHTLGQIFFQPAYPEENPQITVSFGQRMDDMAYRSVITEIEQCRLVQDKIDIIGQHVHSLADLEDMLMDAEFSAQEVQTVLHTLRPPQLAALANKHLAEMEAEWLRERERMLQKHLVDFIAGLPEEQRIQFTRLRAAVVTEE